MDLAYCGARLYKVQRCTQLQVITSFIVTRPQKDLYSGVAVKWIMEMMEMQVRHAHHVLHISCMTCR